MVTTIKVNDDTKRRFDMAQVQLAAKKLRKVTQDEALKQLLDLFEQEEAEVKP